jgi:hypothetical protein
MNATVHFIDGAFVPSVTDRPHHMIAHTFVPPGAANFKIFAGMVQNVPTEGLVMNMSKGAQARNDAIRKPQGVVGVNSPVGRVLPAARDTARVG